MRMASDAVWEHDQIEWSLKGHVGAEGDGKPLKGTKCGKVQPD